MFFVCFSMFYIPCVSCFFFPCHILCFKICLVILSQRRNIFIRLYIISIHATFKAKNLNLCVFCVFLNASIFCVWVFLFTPHLRDKIAFLHSQSLETHTTHFHATFYEIFIFYMFVCIDMQEKTYKKDCLRFFGKNTMK